MQPAYAAFILRIALGIIMIAHAALKVFVFTVPGTVQFFGSIGLFMALVWRDVAGANEPHYFESAARRASQVSMMNVAIVCAAFTARRA